jgi:hypothetical protein
MLGFHGCHGLFLCVLVLTGIALYSATDCPTKTSASEWTDDGSLQITYVTSSLVPLASLPKSPDLQREPNAEFTNAWSYTSTPQLSLHGVVLG